MPVKLPPDGTKKRNKLLLQAKKDLGLPPAEPLKVRVDFWDHVFEPMPQSETILGPNPNVADFGVNIICIPTGLHLTEGTHWHPTGEVQTMEIDGEALVVPIGRQVPNLVTTETGAATVEQKPSKIVAGEVVDRGSNTKERDELPETPNVTAAEIAAARAEAKALREAAKPLPVKEQLFNLHRYMREQLGLWR